jgi:hypothetical protein
MFERAVEGEKERRDQHERDDSDGGTADEAEDDADENVQAE